MVTKGGKEGRNSLYLGLLEVVSLRSSRPSSLCHGSIRQGSVNTDEGGRRSKTRINLPGQSSVMFLKRGIMRYYRVWIYSCNLALFAATIIFITLFIWLLTDIHLSLFTSINFYQPSFIYGFVALVLQGGVLQVSHSMSTSSLPFPFFFHSLCQLLHNTHSLLFNFILL